MVCMISNRSQRYKKIGIFLSKAVKHTRFSAIFHESERDTPVSQSFLIKTNVQHPFLSHFSQKQARNTRISTFFCQKHENDGRVMVVSIQTDVSVGRFPLFSIKTAETALWFRLFSMKTRESGGRIPWFLLKTTQTADRTRWYYPPTIKKICHLQQAAYLSMWSILLSFAKDTVLQL